MNRRAFLSRLVTAPVVVAIPVPVVRPSLLISKLDQPVSQIVRETQMEAIKDQYLQELQTSAEAVVQWTLKRATHG